MPSYATRRRREDAVLQNDPEMLLGSGAAPARAPKASPYDIRVSEGEKLNPVMRFIVAYPGVPIVIVVFILYQLFFHNRSCIF